MTRISHAAMMVAFAAMSGSAPLHAQNMLGGLGGLLGDGLPNIGSVGASNAAGVLSYCMKNKLLGSTRGAASLLGQLTGQEGVESSDAFKLGQGGTLQSGQTMLPLDSIKGRLKTGLCDMVLKHAKTFL